jgi:hypothetical protein
VDLTPFVRQISDLNASVAESVDILRFGSYADRYPGLGRMVSCPLCGRRRRELPLYPCCTSAHATTQRVWGETHDVRGTRDERPDKGFGPRTRHEKHFHQAPHQEWNAEKEVMESMPRVNPEKAGFHNFLKRIQHKRHSNKLRHQIHDMALLLQNEEARNTTQFLLEGLPGFWEPTKGIDLGHIPQFAQRVVKNIRLCAANKKREQQKISRKANRRAK